jgi:glycosyltransferase involved in cell wall biosynthesis
MENIKSIVLIPYCPLPADTGGKIEMWKYLDVLRVLGPCTILSAKTKPVGGGWTAETRRKVEALGFKVVLREEECPRKNLRQWFGIIYAAVCKGLRLEKAFGHSNPYHRYAFPADWWYRHTQDADLAVIHYSYWAWLPCACPKVIALLDVWSDTMWGGYRQEVADLQRADMVTVISIDEQEKLRQRGMRNMIWSPPAVPAIELPDSKQVALLGSASLNNREGLRWLCVSSHLMSINVYGGLAEFADPKCGFNQIGRYDDAMEPYRQCGIILMTTYRGMGVQIKGIEALAAGRAIIARRGAMRGLPEGNGAWVEVDTPEEMISEAKRLQRDDQARLAQMKAAHAYYRKHLDYNTLRCSLRNAYLSLCP